MSEIKITLETLYDILRNEKKKEELQKLEDTFFIDVVVYLKEKKSLLDSKENSSDIFATGERDKLDYELRSIKRILKEIYEKREKKILEIALNRSRTGSDIIDASCMLREEKEFYHKTLEIFDQYRRGILQNLFNGTLPEMTGTRIDLDATSKSKTKIKFVHPVPSFVWKDMKEYGPFEQGDETEIFPEVAELLVKKGRAEKL